MQKTGREIATQTPIEGLNLCHTISMKNVHKTLIGRPRRLTQARIKTKANTNSIMIQTDKIIKNVRRKGTNTEEGMFLHMEIQRPCEKMIKGEISALREKEILQIRNINALQYSYRVSQPVVYSTQHQKKTTHIAPGYSEGRAYNKDPLKLMKPNNENKPRKRESISKPHKSRQEKVYEEIMTTTN